MAGQPVKLNSKNQVELFVEFRESTVHVLAGEKGWDGPIERDEQGNLTAGSVQLLVRELGPFLHRHSWSAPREVLCSIPARGVSIRTISVPVSATENIRAVLGLQVEAQLPLSPDELAWGYLPLNQQANFEGGLQSFLVAAVKTGVLASYQEVCRELQLQPTFVIGALARLSARDSSGNAFALLDVGPNKSELARREAGGTISLRVIPWGSRQLLEVEALARNLQSNDSYPLQLTGVDVPLAPLAGELSTALQQSVEVLPIPTGAGRTAATLGLKAAQEQGGSKLLILELPGVEKPAQISRDEWKWGIAAAILLLLLLAAGFLGPVLQKPRLARQLEELKEYRANLPQIEKELSFLEFIKTNQPPYLDTIYLLANSSPRGLKLETLSIGRRGDVSLRGKASDPDGANNLRSKLVDSGFFSRVVIEEQTPDQNRREVKFRISAELKADGERPSVPEPSSAAATPLRPGRPPGAIPPLPGRS